MAANDEHLTVKHIEHMDEEIFALQSEASELSGLLFFSFFKTQMHRRVRPCQYLNTLLARIEAVKRKEGNEREGLKKKHSDEVIFIKVKLSFKDFLNLTTAFLEK